MVEDAAAASPDSPRSASAAHRTTITAASASVANDSATRRTVLDRSRTAT